MKSEQPMRADNADESVSALVEALEHLLPQHMLSCVARDEIRYLANDDGFPLVTEESCACVQRTKEYRRLLTSHKKSRKGYDPVKSQTNDQ